MTAAPTFIGQHAPSPSCAADVRLQVWREHGATAGEAAQLLKYHARSPLHDGVAGEVRAYPLPDEPFVTAWERYAAEAREGSVFDVLRRRLVQLQFPIAPGVSRTSEYRMATRRGVPPEGTASVRLARPAGLCLFLHPTAAGRVPVVVAEAREDFETLVRALTTKNEPAPVPPSMGACLVSGYNNWDRFLDALRRWHTRHPERPDPFGDVAARKEEYPDRFVLLASGPYSATPAGALGLAADEWAALSLRIRLEHECAHYFMRRAFGVMRESLLDEIVADYAGLVAATGRFRADWFLRFMGLECPAGCRAGGRLENYRGSPPLSDAAFVVLQRVVREAALNLEALDSQRTGAWTLPEQARCITAVTRLGLEGLASPQVPSSGFRVSGSES